MVMDYRFKNEKNIEYMEKIKFFIGFRKNGKEHIYITPCIYSVVLNSVFEEKHSFSIEFQWIYFGIGLRFGWKNKRAEEYPDLAKFL